MDFDEYEYLEKSVESPNSVKVSNKKDNDERPVKSSRNREDDVDAFGDYRSKKPRGEYQNGRKEDRDERERSSRSHRRESDGQVTVKDRERDRDRMSEKEREREKEKERTRDREREKERKREKENDREKEKDREKERSRRSRSRSRGHREGSERENDRGRSRDRDIRGREPDIDIRERDIRKFKDKKEVEAEADPERDQRTVFAYQMPLKASERDAYEFFSKAGKVRDVRLIMDRNSRRSKGVGYIEFYDAMSVPMAIALSGQLLLGQPVMVKPSEAEKNLVQSTASGGSGLGGQGIARKLYVGNLHFNFTEDQLRQVFEPFGPVELVQLPLDLETGHCKGFGFVQFAQLEHAKAAQSLNGKLEIAGRVIKVSAVTDHIGVHDGGTNVGDFDDDESGLSLNAQSRAMLMQKLDRTGTASSIAGSLGIPLLGGPTVNQQALGMALNGQSSQMVTSPTLEPIGDPSECLLLKNMFDPASEMDPDFDLDIKEEVHEECSNFGLVKHIYVDKKSAGFVYLRFATIEAAMKAQKAMHMRWFARRLITALFMRPHEYGAKFGGSS